MVYKVMKHIWQSVINEYNTALQVFISDGSSRERADIDLICIEPVSISANKGIAFTCIFDPVNTGEEYPQLSSGFSLRICSKPAHSFPLEMIQTSLDHHTWPDQPHSPQSRAFAISRYKTGIQPLLLEIVKPWIGIQKRFLLYVCMGNNLLIYTIHQIQKTAILVKVSCIVNHILYPGIIILFRRSLFKPVILNAVKCGRTITRELAQPSDRIALGNPQSKPVLTAVDAVVTGFPGKSATAAQTLITLFRSVCFSKEPNQQGGAVRTSFLCII